MFQQKNPFTKTHHTGTSNFSHWKSYKRNSLIKVPVLSTTHTKQNAREKKCHRTYSKYTGKKYPPRLFSAVLISRKKVYTLSDILAIVCWWASVCVHVMGTLSSVDVCVCAVLGSKHTYAFARFVALISSIFSKCAYVRGECTWKNCTRKVNEARHSLIRIRAHSYRYSSFGCCCCCGSW